MSKWYEVNITVHRSIAVEIPDKTDDPDVWVIPSDDEEAKIQAIDWASSEASLHDWSEAEALLLDSEPQRGMHDDKFSM